MKKKTMKYTGLVLLNAAVMYVFIFFVGGYLSVDEYNTVQAVRDKNSNTYSAIVEMGQEIKKSDVIVFDDKNYYLGKIEKRCFARDDKDKIIVALKEPDIFLEEDKIKIEYVCGKTSILNKIFKEKFEEILK